MLRRFSLLLLPLALAAAQQPAATPYTFQANTRLVEETVTVTDAAGKPVTGLTAQDFIVAEDGKPQTVAFCDFQAIQDNIPPPPAAVASAAPSVAPPTTFQIAPETPGNTRYANRRLVALYFDMVSMQVPEQLRALAAAQRFLTQDVKPADMIAVMTYAGAGVKVEQDFTADRDAVNTALNKLVLATGLGFGENTDDADSADTGSAFGQDDTEFNVFNDNRELAALQTAVDMLAPIHERKSLVYFASGLSLHEVDNEAELESAINAAIRANVNLFPVDARGLVASAPLGDATQGSPGGVSMYNGGAAQAFNLRLQQSQDTLHALGADTGGKALLDANNLAAGIVQARNAITSYYILGYYTSNAALDGKYRRIKVTLRNPALVKARLVYRNGYYAGKVFDKFTDADKERQLEDALLLGDPITDLTLSLEVNYFQLNSAEYFVPIAVKIPGSELALAKKGGAQRSLIDFIGEVKDSYGTTIANFRDHVVMNLNGSTAAQLAQVPIEYTAGFTLLPDKYSIKVLARDAETGRIGTYMSDFTVPNLMKVAGTLPISSVVLSSERVPIEAAVFNAQKNAVHSAAETTNPLVQNGVELMPSVTRVFHRPRTMYIYLQAYEHSATAMQPLEAYVDFYSGGKQALETPLAAMGQGAQDSGDHAGAVPISLEVPLAPLAPGRYTVQVTVLDPASQLANFWRTEIEVVP